MFYQNSKVKNITNSSKSTIKTNLTRNLSKVQYFKIIQCKTIRDIYTSDNQETLQNIPHFNNSINMSQVKINTLILCFNRMATKQQTYKQNDNLTQQATFIHRISQTSQVKVDDRNQFQNIYQIFKQTSNNFINKVYICQKTCSRPQGLNKQTERQVLFNKDYVCEFLETRGVLMQKKNCVKEQL